MRPALYTIKALALVLNWLTHDWHFLGMTGQIWMPVFAAAAAGLHRHPGHRAARDTRAH